MLQKAVRWAGRLIAILAVAVLIWAAKANWAALSGWRITPQLGLLIAAVSVAYGFALLLLGEAWHRIVSGFSIVVLARSTTLPSFGVTQVAKYLPGNVFHYVGRHIWLARRGVPHRAIITAAVWEAALLSGSALLCAGAMGTLFPLPLNRFVPFDLAVSLKALVGVLIAGLLAVIAIRRMVPRLAALIPPPGALIPAGAVHVTFFLIQGMLFSLLFAVVGLPPTPTAVAIASLSWVAGYLTPGAPGGIGSREAVVLALTAPLVGAANALILGAAFRVVTTGGDLVCFGISSAIARWGQVSGQDTASAL